MPKCRICGTISEKLTSGLCSSKCRTRYQILYYTSLVEWAINKIGRKCSRCGLVSNYNCIYDFHHNNKIESWSKNQHKQTAYSQRMKEILKWKRNNKIPDDVFLVCSNCHRIMGYEEDKKPELNISITNKYCLV